MDVAKTQNPTDCQTLQTAPHVPYFSGVLYLAGFPGSSCMPPMPAPEEAGKDRSHAGDGKVPAELLAQGDDKTQEMFKAMAHFVQRLEDLLDRMIKNDDWRRVVIAAVLEEAYSRTCTVLARHNRLDRSSCRALCRRCS